MYASGSETTTRPANGSEGEGAAPRPRNQLRLRLNPTRQQQNAKLLELAPRVKLRPPATDAITTVPSSQVIEDYDDDDDILFENSSHVDAALLSPRQPQPSENSQVPMETNQTDPEETNSNSNSLSTRENLLKLRKDYKKTSVSLVKTRAHGSFISTCKDQAQTPRGLRINVNCSAFLSDLTDVKQEFATTSKKAESGYVGHLQNHYHAVEQELKTRKTVLLDTMTGYLKKATPEEHKEHTDLRLRTDSNMKKLAHVLASKKKRKLDQINEPPPKRKRNTPTTRNNAGSNGPVDRPPMVSRNATDRPNLAPNNNYVPHPLHTSPRPSPLHTPSTTMPSQNTPPQFLSPQAQLPNIMGMTLGDLFSHLQQQPPPLPTANCTLEGAQPPELVHPSGKVGSGQPAMLFRPFQQCQRPPPMYLQQPPPMPTANCTLEGAQPPELVHPSGKVGSGQPAMLFRPFQQCQRPPPMYPQHQQMNPPDIGRRWAQQPQLTPPPRPVFHQGGRQQFQRKQPH